VNLAKVHVRRCTMKSEEEVMQATDGCPNLVVVVGSWHACSVGC
jgi:hypothetical protein